MEIITSNALERLYQLSRGARSIQAAVAGFSGDGDPGRRANHRPTN